MPPYDYVFLERWVLSASTDAVFHALADFELYPQWGHPGYLAGSRQGEPGAVGTTGRLLIQGGLPYKVKMNCRITRVIPGRELEVAVSGDLDGVAIKTVRPMPDGGAEFISDFRCNPHMPLIRALTPVLRPLFCWNHAQAINAAVAGLARYLGDAGAPAGPVRRPPPSPRVSHV